MFDLIDIPTLEILEFFFGHPDTTMSDFHGTRTHQDRMPVLEEWGLLERSKDPLNYKRKLVHITPKGMSVLFAMYNVRDAMEEQ